jgi:hypothetical protein
VWAIAAIVLIGISGWQFYAIYNEVSKKLPPDLSEPHAIRFTVDPFIWSFLSSASLRRRYVFAQGCALASMACLAAFLWQDSFYAAVLFAVLTLIGSGILCWQCMRHGLS